MHAMGFVLVKMKGEYKKNEHKIIFPFIEIEAKGREMNGQHHPGNSNLTIVKNSFTLLLISFTSRHILLNSHAFDSIKDGAQLIMSFYVLNPHVFYVNEQALGDSKKL